MEIDLAIPVAVAVIWLSAGIIVDSLPRRSTARVLHRRTRLLLTLTVTGLVTIAAASLAAVADPGPAPADRVVLGLALPTAPAVVAGAVTVRRLGRLWRAAGAFAAAPGTPAPPSLRAAAAHPMTAVPVQVTGILALPATVAIGPGRFSGTAVTGLLLTAAALVAMVIGVRHSLRHNRLTEAAVTGPDPGGCRHPRPTKRPARSAIWCEPSRHLADVGQVASR